MYRREVLQSSLFCFPFDVPKRTWRQGIYISQPLYDKLGYDPVRIADEHVKWAFRKAHINVETETFEPVNINPNNLDEMCEKLDEWDGEKRDSNICLVDAPPAGCAYINGNTAFAGAPYLKGIRHTRTRPHTANGFTLLAILHEICHNAGYRHSDALGKVTVTEDYHRSTPAYTPRETDIQGCNYHPPREKPFRFVYEFSNCMEKQIRDYLRSGRYASSGPSQDQCHLPPEVPPQLP